MKRKRKEKPVLQVLLIAALALNTTLSFVVLANRNRMAQATEKKDPVPAPAVITLETAAVEEKTHAAPTPASRPDAGVSPKGTRAPETTARKTAPARLSDRRGERMRLPFSRRPFSTGSRGIRFSLPEEMARESIFQEER
jgi:hypothetical protein